ncbi:MAG: saccharopine dehydrogenase NADP-binding domain-containing protein [Patescibacteria group bacterium]|jgi:predicted amino acid dehydrogenase
MLHVIRTHGALSEYEENLSTPSAGSVNTAFLIHPPALGSGARMTPAGVSSKLARRLEKANQSPVQRNAIRRMFFDPALKELDGRIVGHYALRTRRRRSFGALLFIPCLAEDFLDESKHEEILGSIRRAAVFARDSLGVGCLGLGAFTSIAARTTLTTERVIPNTSGSHGTAIGIHGGVVRAMRDLKMNPKKSRIVIVGATGAVGRPTCLLLAKRFGNVAIVARNITKLRRLADELTQYGVTPEAVRAYDASRLNTAISGVMSSL